MASSTTAPPRSLDAALAGLDALAAALERAAGDRVGWNEHPRSPVVVHRVAADRQARRSFAGDVVRLAFHVCGALLLVAALLGLAGWVLMALLPDPPRPAPAGVAGAVPIHLPVPPAP